MATVPPWARASPQTAKIRVRDAAGATLDSATVGEELLEAQAIEEPLTDSAGEPLETPRPLPERAPAGAVDVWRGEVRTAALAAAGGLVAGAATVAAVRAVRGPGQAARKGLRRRAKARGQNIVASRSFLVDVHVLGR